MEAGFVILVAEDDENDVFLLRQAFKRAGLAHPIQVVGDGQQVIDYLAGVGKYANRELHPLPKLAIFDIKMPKRDGFEALQWARQQARFNRLPIMMHSSSGEMRDITRAYELGASAYLIKSAHIQELSEALGKACRYWQSAGAEQDFLAVRQPLHFKVSAGMPQPAM